MDTELHQRIAQLRRQAGLTQEQLGEKLGVSRQAVSKWESGQANPDVTYIVQMCRLFKVSSDWLLLGEESVQPPDASTGSAQAEAQDTYCLYLSSNLEHSWGVARKIARLFEYPWARPAFPWDGQPLEDNLCWHIAQDAPMVLCRGLSWEQAVEGARVFRNYPAILHVYRDRDVPDDITGQARPITDSLTLPVPAREPMGPGMVFLMVVLGVVAAILLMSFF